MADRGF